MCRKALPSLGRTLDMHDSHPAEKLSTGAHHQRGSYAPGTGLHRPCLQDRRCGTAEQCQSLVRRDGTYRRRHAVLAVLDLHAGKDDKRLARTCSRCRWCHTLLHVDPKALQGWLSGEASPPIVDSTSRSDFRLANAKERSSTVFLCLLSGRNA